MISEIDYDLSIENVDGKIYATYSGSDSNIIYPSLFKIDGVIMKAQDKFCLGREYFIVVK